MLNVQMKSDSSVWYEKCNFHSIWIFPLIVMYTRLLIEIFESQTGMDGGIGGTINWNKVWKSFE